jgi:hypothetical protein
VPSVYTSKQSNWLCDSIKSKSSHVKSSTALALALDDEGDRIRDAFAGENLAAPEIIDLEVASVWRGTFPDERRSALALSDLDCLPLAITPHERLLGLQVPTAS